MSYSPVITITGKIQDFLGNNAVGATVSVRLTNFATDNPRVPGSCIISSPKIPVAQDGLGGFSFTPIGNDVITPPNTYYLVIFTSDTANTASVAIPYQFTGSGTQDLSQIIPFNQAGGSGGPSVSNLVIKNPTALQIITGFGLSLPQIQDLTAPLLPHTAAGTDIGSAALPFANLYVGSAAANNIKITGTATAARTFTLPDANSNAVQPVSGATAHQWLTFIDSSGVQHTAQPSFSDLSGTLTIGQVPTITSAQVDSSIEIVAHKNLANGYAGLDGTAKIAASQLPNPSATTLGGVESIAQQPSKWISTISTSGVPSLTQPAFADISGTLIAAQEPSTTVNAVTNDTNVHGSISAQTLTISWNGLLGLARGGLNADLSATGGPSQVLKQSAGGAAITVGQLAFTDISGTASTGQIPNLSALKITSGQIALAQGGTGVDLSASGGTTKILAQDASHVISARDLVAGDIPSLAASKITSGQLALTQGGTGVDLSATGGTSQVLKQTTVGGNITVGQLAFTDISGSVAGSQLPFPGLSTLGGILELVPVSHQWVNQITSTGVPLTSQPAASDLANGTTGSGAVVLATAPTIGAATVTSINKLAITAPATGSTLAIADGKTLTANNTLTLAGTDSTTLTFQGTGTVVNRDSTDTLTHKTIDTAGTGNHVQLGGVDLPASIGTNGQVLTNSSGVLAFTTVSGGGGGTPGGATNSIQYNDGAAFAGSMCLTPAGTIAPNAAFKSSIKTFSATGNSDLYTCPANKRAIITEMTVFNGHATNSSTLVAMLKIGGVYYPASASTSVLAQSTGSRSVTYVLEAGEILAVNMSQQPFNVVVSIMEFDNTSNLKSAKLTTSTLTSGDNTVYTVPNGKSALVLNNTLTMCSGTQGTFTAGNNSGGNITYKWNVVPSGGSVGTTNQMSASVTVSTGAASSQTLTGFTMGAGDFISVNLSAGTSDQIAFVTVVEI
jgi:hypothetical protein